MQTETIAPILNTGLNGKNSGKEIKPSANLYVGWNESLFRNESIFDFLLVFPRIGDYGNRLLIIIFCQIAGMMYKKCCFPCTCRCYIQFVVAHVIYSLDTQSMALTIFSGTFKSILSMH